MFWPYKNFSEREMECRCGLDGCPGLPDSVAFHTFMRKLDAWRDELGHPVTVISGYRCPLHPQKSVNHVTGCAIDFSVDVKPVVWEPLARAFGFTGIGYRNVPGQPQKNHIDTAHAKDEPALWTYT